MSLVVKLTAVKTEIRISIISAETRKDNRAKNDGYYHPIALPQSRQIIFTKHMLLTFIRGRKMNDMLFARAKTPSDG